MLDPGGGGGSTSCLIPFPAGTETRVDDDAWSEFSASLTTNRATSLPLSQDEGRRRAAQSISLFTHPPTHCLFVALTSFTVSRYTPEDCSALPSFHLSAFAESLLPPSPPCPHSSPPSLLLFVTTSIWNVPEWLIVLLSFTRFLFLPVFWWLFGPKWSRPRCLLAPAAAATEEEEEEEAAAASSSSSSEWFFHLKDAAMVTGLLLLWR